MRYLLDTNILIDIARHRSAAEERVAQLRPGDAGMSIVTYFELVYGAEKSPRPRENFARVEQLESLIPVLALDGSAAMHYGRLRSDLERRGSLIGALDMLIAAHALSLGLTLVTNNTREFARIEGLRIENWGAH